MPIGSLWHRLLYAAKFADVNILLSDRVNSDSKIIYDRTPRERVQKAAPWLKVGRRRVSGGGRRPDRLDRGRLHHVELLPVQPAGRAERGHLGLPDHRPGHVVAQPDTNINYMRNSVKAVVDAYDGTVKLYAWDETDPVLQTWQKAFPGTVQPKCAISADLLSAPALPAGHVQGAAQILARYHMTDPYNWYLQSGLWEMPERPGRRRRQQRQGDAVLPVDQVARVDRTPIFSLTTVYVPKGRSNLAAYMAVNADAGSPDYGRMRILRMSDTTQIDGPGQTANAMVTNENVAERLRPFQPGLCQRPVRQPAHLAGRRRSALRAAGLHPAAGQHRLISGAALRDGSVRSAGRHRRHPAAGAGPGVRRRLRR